MAHTQKNQEWKRTNGERKLDILSTFWFDGMVFVWRTHLGAFFDGHVCVCVSFYSVCGKAIAICSWRRCRCPDFTASNCTGEWIFVIQPERLFRPCRFIYMRACVCRNTLFVVSAGGDCEYAIDSKPPPNTHITSTHTHRARASSANARACEVSRKLLFPNRLMHFHCSIHTLAAHIHAFACLRMDRTAGESMFPSI